MKWFPLSSLALALAPPPDGERGGRASGVEGPERQDRGLDEGEGRGLIAV